MYNLHMKTRIPLKVELRSSGGYKVAIPRCSTSRKACKILNEKFLVDHQLKMLELLGCEIEYKEEEIEPQTVYFRSKY